MLDWCDSGVPASDLAEAGEIEPDADPALPRDEGAAAQPDDELAFGDEEAFFRNEATSDREDELAICDDEAFFRNEATPDGKDEPDICDDEAFSRNEATSDGEARRAEIAKAPQQFLPALPDCAMKRKAQSETGLAAGPSAQPEKHAPSIDPRSVSRRPIDAASHPTVPNVRDPRMAGVPIQPVAGSPRAP